MTNKVLQDIMDAIEEIRQHVADQSLVNQTPLRDCMTVEEVARLALCSEKKIRQEEKNGVLVARYPRSRRRFHKDDVFDYLRGK